MRLSSAAHRVLSSTLSPRRVQTSGMEVSLATCAIATSQRQMLLLESQIPAILRHRQVLPWEARSNETRHLSSSRLKQHSVTPSAFPPLGATVLGSRRSQIRLVTTLC